MAQIGVLCVLVEEYRGGVKIGETVRDAQFIVDNCSNIPPEASGVNGAPNTDPANFQTSICENGPLCFTIDGSDPNGNNVTMSWNNEIPTGTFTVTNNGTTNPQAQFCWTPTAVGTYFFTVNLADDNCPITGNATYTYEIEVLPSPNTLDAGPDAAICGGECTALNAISSGAISYSWSPASGLSTTTGASTTACPTASTTYTVFASFPDGAT